MNIVRTIAEMQAQARAWRVAGDRVGLVPTMGFLHDGHLSLVDIARRRAERVVVSIFVNPTQFGPTEDLAAYPRDFERDEAMLRSRGVDVVFYPSVEEMYPADASTWVTEVRLSRPLCGAARPTHFRGVTTIVAKLFNAALPDVAVFGQKDAQQALVLQRMNRDLNFPIEIVIAPIVREADGLAMSSRNKYLTPAERAAAPAVNRGLDEVVAAFAAGERDTAALIAIVRARIEASGGRVDYIECRRTRDLELVETVTECTLIAVAAWYGKARLLDNRVLEV